MSSSADPTFNIAGFQISESFAPGFLQSGSPLANDINSLSHISSFPELASLAVKTYNDLVHAGVKITYEDTNIFTGRSGFSLVLTEGNNTIGALGVSGLTPVTSQIAGIVSMPHL
jgi:hypothetical protein